MKFGVKRAFSYKAFAFALLVLGISPHHALAQASPLYRVVIDAGSSGSRIYLFEVTPGPYPIVKQLAAFKGVKGDDGLDNFLDGRGGVEKNLGPEAVGSAMLSPLLREIQPKLDELKVSHKDVTVDLLATAGMRSVQKPIGEHDVAAVDAFYAKVRAAIEVEGFPAGEVRTTDGSAEEGIWTWVDLNDRYRDAFRSTKQPVGIVEVGGSSLQVSFPIDGLPNPAANVYEVKINGRSFSVFDRTYIGLGQDDARKAMRVLDPPADGGSQCFPTGMTAAQDEGDFVGGKHITIKGTAVFDAKACAASYAQIISGPFVRLGKPDVASSISPFYGISAARYALEEIGASPQLPSEKSIADTIARKCAVKDAVANFKITSKYAQRACAGAAYIQALLYGSEGLFHDKPELFKSTIADKVEVDPASTGTITWTRGYLLQKYGS
ncbi:hypothetical protein [Aestuariivirga sp.]|uniref:hypothetical protein n=1 Tax=Aestuariivirga sp. TaxID=2650926 RepID=UPI003BA9B26C